MSTPRTPDGSGVMVFNPDLIHATASSPNSPPGVDSGATDRLSRVPVTLLVGLVR